MAGFVSFSSSGMWDGDKVTRKVSDGAARGVNKALERLKALSVPLAPIDRGPLRASATVKPATPTKHEGALIFDTPYAAAQHEHTEYAHDDGQAKYVEQPLTQHGRELQGIIGKEIRSGLLNA